MSCIRLPCDGRPWQRPCKVSMRRVCKVCNPYLVVVVDERVGNDDVLATGGSEDDDFGNVVGSKRLNTAVHC